MKKLPLGYEDFKTIIDNDFYFVDKSELIKDFLDNLSIVTLFTRPRRFGKTLNMSMVKYFFERTNEDNSYLFKNLKIASYGDKYMKYQGQYPVVFLTLKDMKQGNFEDSFLTFKRIVSVEFQNHDYLLKSNKIINADKIDFQNIINRTADDSTYLDSLNLLVRCLDNYFDKKVIVLIDEYDVPLQDGWVNNKDNYYNKIRDLIRSLFSSALKSNPSLEFAILTGSMRIAKEEIFTGLNNFIVYSIQNNEFSSYFGFTKDEVLQIAKDYSIDKKSLSEMQRWYDGYTFGNTDIFNPWSILTCISRIKSKDADPFQSFWANTSGNDIIRTLIDRSNINEKSQIEQLIAGKTVSKRIFEEMTFAELDKNPDYIWTMLYLTGYLTAVKYKKTDDGDKYFDLKIPNLEVKTIFRNSVIHWFDEKIKNDNNSSIFKYCIEGETEKFEDEIIDWLVQSISYYDGHENYYHGFLMGLLASKSGNYLVESNREEGIGRSDITIKDIGHRRLAVIIEIKVAKDYDDMDRMCDVALQQIRTKQYDMKLKAQSYKRIIKYGIAFFEKSCMIKKEE